jgi:hypothetical protein
MAGALCSQLVRRKILHTASTQADITLDGSKQQFFSTHVWQASTHEWAHCMHPRRHHQHLASPKHDLQAAHVQHT